MKKYTQADLDDLISCAKSFIEPPKREMKDEVSHIRNDARLESPNADGTFYIFMRVNSAFRENFSIGLDYHPIDGGRFTLIRMNGPHGPFNQSDSPHFQFHIHRVTSQALDEGKDAMKNADPTSAYASYEEALKHFMLVTGISDWERYFPSIAKSPLFEGI